MDLPQNDLKDHTINAPVLDWSTTPLSKAYAGYYVKIIDNVFTDEECTALIKLAESDAEWKQAAVHYGLQPDQNYVDTEYRNSERILRFDHDAAEKLYQKLLPYVQELVEIKKGGKWDKIVGTRHSGTWTMVGCVFPVFFSSTWSHIKKVSVGLTSAWVFYDTEKETTSENTAMDSSNYPTAENRA